MLRYQALCTLPQTVFEIPVYGMIGGFFLRIAGKRLLLFDVTDLFYQ